MDLEQQKHNRPYANTLAYNIDQAVPESRVTIHRNYIMIVLPENVGDHKQWLYSLLESLQEINYPIETVRFVIRANGELQYPQITINPSESDVRGLDYAIESGLQFSKQSSPYSTGPLPLDHPWYTDKDYFKKQSKAKSKKSKLSPEAELFKKIKDQPNVKVILDKMRADGLDI